ncbi:MAG: hypothetical protein ACK5N8_05595 [Alphaproteobacteria bacterium]
MTYKSYLKDTSNNLLTQMQEAVSGDSIAESGLKSLLKSVSYENYSPVKRVEDILGVSGVQQQYKFPQDIEPLEFESYLKPLRIFEIEEKGYLPFPEKEAMSFILPQKKEALKFAESAFDELAKLNPELKEIPNKKTIHNYVAILSGVCSGFPIEDITEFCDYIRNDDQEKCEHLNYMRKEYSHKIKELIKQKGKPNNSKDVPELTKRLEKGGVFLNWCPSKASFEKIYSALDKNLDRQQFLSAHFIQKRR